MMKDSPAEDLKTLRQKYVGARLDPEKVEKEYAFLDLKFGTFELTFFEVDWDVGECRYEFSADVDSEGRITKIHAPHCLVTVSHDIQRSSYRGKRMDDTDYLVIDKKLGTLVQDEP